MSFLVIANFKSHKTQSEVESWLKEVAPLAKSCPATIALAPSFPHLSTIHDLRSTISLAAQDVSPFPPGSYTGAVSASQLKDLGVTYCIVGHSERREYFHETPMDVANKVKELVTVGITPIVCLRKGDLAPQRAALDEQLIPSCYFCYEPPADIGGTVTAPVEDIKQTISQISQIFGTQKVMYGGSVNADNIMSLLPLGIQGVIVATACLDSASFNQIIAKLSHAEI